MQGRGVGCAGAAGLAAPGAADHALAGRSRSGRGPPGSLPGPVCAGVGSASPLRGQDPVYRRGWPPRARVSAAAGLLQTLQEERSLVMLRREGSDGRAGTGAGWLSAGPRRQAVAVTAARGLCRFARARGIPPGPEFLLDYDVIEAFCVAGLPGRAPSTRAPTGRRCTGSRCRCTARRNSGRRRLPGRKRPRRVRPPDAPSPPWQPPSVTRPGAAPRWPWWWSAIRAPGCGPASWWRCAAAT